MCSGYSSLRAVTCRTQAHSGVFVRLPCFEIAFLCAHLLAHAGESVYVAHHRRSTTERHLVEGVVAGRRRAVLPQVKPRHVHRGGSVIVNLQFCQRYERRAQCVMGSGLVLLLLAAPGANPTVRRGRGRASDRDGLCPALRAITALQLRFRPITTSRFTQERGRARNAVKHLDDVATLTGCRASSCRHFLHVGHQGLHDCSKSFTFRHQAHFGLCATDVSQAGIDGPLHSSSVDAVIGREISEEVECHSGIRLHQVGSQGLCAPVQCSQRAGQEDSDSWAGLSGLRQSLWR
eukprot:scaffold5692_cov74-Phaeocystis_antarctica.AAC.6